MCELLPEVQCLLLSCISLRTPAPMRPLLWADSRFEALDAPETPDDCVIAAHPPSSAVKRICVFQTPVASLSGSLRRACLGSTWFGFRVPVLLRVSPNAPHAKSQQLKDLAPALLLGVGVLVPLVASPGRT